MNTVSFETGASDHHKRIETMLWSTFATVNLRKIFYRCHKNFDNEKFEEELKTHLSSVPDFESFHFAFKTILDQFAPLKQRNNNLSWLKPFVKLLWRDLN